MRWFGCFRSSHQQSDHTQTQTQKLIGVSLKQSRKTCKHSKILARSYKYLSTVRTLQSLGFKKMICFDTVYIHSELSLELS